MTSSAEARILVVDDNADMTRMVAEKLVASGYAVEVANSGEEAIAAVKARVLDAVVSDLRMQRIDGLDVLDAVRQLDPHLPVLIMTAFGAIDTAIAAIPRGAYHYLTKPFPLQELLVYLQRAISDRKLRDEHRALQKVAYERTSLGAMVGRSKAMTALFELIERVAQSSAPVLIRGESGSGKELVARARCTSRARGGRSRSWPSTARRFPKRCSRASSSATHAARSPARRPHGAGCSWRQTAGPCSSTRSADAQRDAPPCARQPARGRFPSPPRATMSVACWC
jgi:DNA-binding response OmpR family regulator